jgi:hypothetical protein
MAVAGAEEKPVRQRISPPIIGFESGFFRSNFQGGVKFGSNH